MEQILNYPLLIFFLTLVCLWAAARIGALVRSRRKVELESDRDEYSIVLSASLTLLGLLIGFSFSMAISRYDLRKDYEEEEANAIGTEYLRADVLPDAVRVNVQEGLKKYLDLRIARYDLHASQDPTEIASKTASLQDAMWKDVKNATTANPNPAMVSVLTGMNDVINRQGYTQAARWNRIPPPAWALMATIALFSNFLIGFGAKRVRVFVFGIVPLAIAVSFMLIADIDSPQGGTIRVVPHNLITLADSLKAR